MIPRTGRWRVCSTRHHVKRDALTPMLRATVDVEWRALAGATAPWPQLDFELRPLPESYLGLSFVGEVHDGRHVTTCGQCLDTIAREFAFDPQMMELVRFWRRWHLNTMRPGLRVQEVAVRAFRRAHTHGQFTYDMICQWLETQTLLRVGSWQPKPDLLPRPYLYGEAWLVEPVPDAVVLRLDLLLTAMKAQLVASEV